MKKRIVILFVLAFLVFSPLFAVKSNLEYDTISLYLHGRVGVDAHINRLSSQNKSEFDREGVVARLGLDIYKNEDLDGKYGYTFGLDFDYPFHTKNNKYGYPSSLPYLSLNGGIVLRARPWDYIDFNITGKINLSTTDYQSLMVGLALETSLDLYVTDYFYLKGGLEYGAVVTRFLFADAEYYLDRNYMMNSFSFTLGGGYAFGGYSL